MLLRSYFPETTDLTYSHTFLLIQNSMAVVYWTIVAFIMHLVDFYVKL